MLPNIKKSHGIQASLAPFYVPLIKFHLSNTQNPHLFQFHVCIFHFFGPSIYVGTETEFFSPAEFQFLTRVTKTSNAMKENATSDK